MLVAAPSRSVHDPGGRGGTFGGEGGEGGMAPPHGGEGGSGVGAGEGGAGEGGSKGEDGAARSTGSHCGGKVTPCPWRITLNPSVRIQRPADEAS